MMTPIIIQSHPPVGRFAACTRCMTSACPRCAYRPIASPFSFKVVCPRCELVIDKGNGYLLGALPIAYSIFVVFWLLPFLVLWILKLVSYPMAFGLIGLGAIVWPIVLFNYCKMLSLSAYYFFMYRELGVLEGQE